MSGLNKVMIIGNVGTDPEMRFIANGTPVTSFTVATSRTYNTSDGEKKQETEWFNVKCWRKLAENCNQFLTKGRKVYVEGSLRSSSWEGQDGQKRTRVEVVATTVLFLERQATASLPNEDGSVEVAEEGVEPEDLPFNP
jgi:single-strand DNA-binding protein